MSAPVPPALPAALAALAAAVAAGGSTGTLVSLPPDMLRFEVGQQLHATVAGRAGTGHLLLNTHLGPVTLQTTAAIPAGTPVLLHFQTGGATPQVHIQVAQGTAIPPVASQPAAAAPTAPAANPTPADTTILTQGQTLVAQVVGPPPSAPSSAAAGTASATASPAGASQAPPGDQPPLPPGSSLTIRIVAVVPPTLGGIASSAAAGAPAATAMVPPAALPNASPAAALVHGVVGGTTASGAALVQTPLGQLALSLPTPPPSGTAIAFTIDRVVPPQPVTPPALSLSAQWQALAQALPALQQAAPAAAQSIMQQATPQSGAGFTVGMLFFLSALAAGDLRRWLGSETMRTLERIGGGHLDRLRADLAEMRQLSSEAAGQDWRVVMLPVLADQGLAHLRVFLRDQRNPDAGSDGPPATRFVVEAQFSRLGHFQLDGLSRPKDLHLIVRTEAALDEAICRDIRAIFTDTVTALDCTGELTFQVVRPFPVNPLLEHAARGMGVTV